MSKKEKVLIRSVLQGVEEGVPAKYTFSQVYIHPAVCNTADMV